MTSPRVLDAKGRELSADAPVERIINGVQGGIVGKVLVVTKLDVMVEWLGPHHCFYKPERHSVIRRAFRCPDLLLLDPEGEGETNG